jgi:phage/plasmid primase-like uncharacterized protein
MANLKSILGEFTPPLDPILASPESQFRDAMQDAGITPPDHIYMDGTLHRFQSGDKKDKTGWYILYDNVGVPAGIFGDWRTNIEQTFRANIGRKLTSSESISLSLRLSEAKATRAAELEKKHLVASNTAQDIWDKCTEANQDHPYLKRKGISVHNARVTGDGRLVVPLYDENGELSSLQYIDAEGNKLYLNGGATGAKFWIVGDITDPGIIYIAEGFATAATIHEVSSRPCVVAYSASNLVPVTEIIRHQYGATQNIVIVADNDVSEVGKRYAEQASAKFGARMVIPPILGDANDYHLKGNDLSALLAPPQDDWLVQANDFCAQPAPIVWLVKHWIQDQALIMVHGPSGGGKTFAVLDWCLSIASGKQDWHGNKVKAGNIVYLAGEGHHGLRGRVAAWKHHNKATNINMWLSKSGCDLNTPAGYQKVVDHIRSLKEKPSVIVVDTLHRFLLGDENSAQDAKTMLDACSALIFEFGCTVILVHHTGVSDEAQHRARGSSAWRGALDIEISIVPGSDKMPMQIIQRKSKDAELAQNLNVELVSIVIPNWFDEDGEPVTSAIIMPTDKTVEPKKDSKIATFMKQFEKVWWASGAEELNGFPYVSRSAMRDKLAQDGYAKRTITNMMNASETDKLIGNLLLSDIIAVQENGWIVVDEVQSSAMLLSK